MWNEGIAGKNKNLYTKNFTVCTEILVKSILSVSSSECALGGNNKRGGKIDASFLNSLFFILCY